MKKIIFLIVIASLSFFVVKANLTIQDYCDIRINAPAGIKEMRPMQDGISYMRIGENGNTIEKFSYKTGEFII